MLSTGLLLLVELAFSAVLVFTIRKFLSARTFSIPGPLFARLTRLRFLRATISGEFEKDNFKLHQKYGKIVRIAPRTFTIDDPEAIEPIYGTHARFPKSSWYSTFQIPHLPNLFSDTDNIRHGIQRKKYHRAYTVSAMSSYERYVDDIIQVFISRMRKKVESKESFDLSWWLQCFALDVITQITFSERFGFLDEGHDVKNMIDSLRGNQVVSSTLAVYPAVWRPLFGVFWLLGKLGLAGSNVQAYFGEVEMQKWKECEQMTKSSAPKDIDDSKPKDFLMKFMEAYREGAGFTTDDALVGLSTNIIAGSDTTSTALSAILYFLSKNPKKMARLRQELEDAEAKGEVSNPITFKESQGIEYLQAVIKEALRLWPAVSMPYFRVVPKGGAIIAGQYFEAGDEVGINPWVAHRNASVFGPDAETFRPERWLKSQDDAEALSKLDHYWIPFGIGSRTCLGKNVSLLEIGKLVPEIVRRFDFELGSELLENGPKSRNILFLVWENLNVQVRDVVGH